MTPCAQGNLNFDKTSLIPSTIFSAYVRSSYVKAVPHRCFRAFVAPELDLLRVIADRALSRFTRKFHTDVTGERTTSSADAAETRLRLCENEFRGFSAMKAATSSRVKIRFRDELSSISPFRRSRANSPIRGHDAALLSPLTLSLTLFTCSVLSRLYTYFGHAKYLRNCESSIIRLPRV